LFLKGDPEVTAELKLAQERGLPLPWWRELRGTDRKSKKYKIVTAHNVESWVSYRWVELGPQERAP